MATEEEQQETEHLFRVIAGLPPTSPAFEKARRELVGRAVEATQAREFEANMERMRQDARVRAVAHEAAAQVAEERKQRKREEAAARAATRKAQAEMVSRAERKALNAKYEKETIARILKAEAEKSWQAKWRRERSEAHLLRSTTDYIKRLGRAMRPVNEARKLRDELDRLEDS
ncbi:MAG: hypothetical protein ACRDMH_12675 [Solirubrobacterales bacterium]